MIGMLFLALSPLVWAAPTQVVSSIDKEQVQINEEIALNIRIEGAHGNLQAPRLPNFNGFDSFYTGRTSHFTFVNGKSSSTVEFSYVLVPKVAGRFTLDPVQVWVDGKSYITQPLEVVVSGPSIQPQAPQGQALPTSQPPPSLGQVPPPALSQPTSSAPQVINDDNVFVKASIDRQTVYPNEQILLTYTLYTRYDTRYEGFEEEPSVSGFWIEDFPLDRDLGRETVTERGKRYVKADIRKIALFPTASAEYTIQPGVLKVSVREEPKNSSLFDEFFGDSFFSGASFFSKRSDRLLKPPSLTIKVRPFPEKGKPASFNGAAGQFRMTASVDRQEVKQNEPVTLKIILEGEGNIETLPKPAIPELTGFKIYDGDASTELYKSGTTIGGKKKLETIFIPTEAGDLFIPPLVFAFFDPRRESYQVLQTQPFPVKVTPSAEPLRLPAELAEKDAFKKELKLEGRDIRFIQEEFPSGRLSRIQNLLFRGLAGVNLLGLFLVGTGLLWRRREAAWSRDAGLKRRKTARATALQQMKKLKQSMTSQKSEEAEQFMREAEKVLNEYFANQFNVSPYGLTQGWIEEKLTEIWGPEDPVLKQVQEFYEVARETRFGRGALLAQERREFYLLINTVISRIEKLR